MQQSGPIGLKGAGGLGVDCGNGCLQGVGTETPCSQRSFDQPHAFPDVMLIPQRAVLMFQQYEFFCFRRACGTP